MPLSQSSRRKKTRLRDRISPRAVRGYPGGGPRAVPGVPRASQRRKFVAEQLELLQPSLYEDQTLSKNWTFAPERLPEGRPTVACASAPPHSRRAGCSPGKFPLPLWPQDSAFCLSASRRSVRHYRRWRPPLPHDHRVDRSQLRLNPCRLEPRRTDLCGSIHKRVVP
jgi:hypothetical protein